MKALKSFSAYNQWGDRIYITNTYGEGWNGKFKGQDQNPGVYVWILEFFDNNNKLVVERGYYCYNPLRPKRVLQPLVLIF